MLLRLLEPDMLNTELIDISSGKPKYIILTRASYIQGNENVIVDVASRHTFVKDISGRQVAEIEWTGRDKKSGGIIRINKSDPIKVAELFGGCETIKTPPHHLLIPTRIGYTWVATSNSLLVCDSETGEVIMKYYEHCVQIGNSFIPSPVKKFGHDFLEFSDFSEDVIAELIVGYLLVNIMRRAHFDLPKYQFPLVDYSGGHRKSTGNNTIRTKAESWKKTCFRRNTFT